MASPELCLFNQAHLWCSKQADGTVIIGISEHAQNSLGEITYVELPDPDTDVTQNISLGIIESIKVVNELISPVSGTVVEINENLSSNPKLVNDSPYDEGWMLHVRIDNPDELDNLMNAEQYIESLGS